MKNKLHGIYLCWCILVFTYALVNADDSEKPKRGFLATFPASVIPGTSADLCIRFYNVQEDVIVQIEDSETHVFESIKQVLTSDTETCIKVNIKENMFQENTIRSITVIGETVDGSYKFNETKRFNYKTQTSITFIETDKPIYKPGQLVRVRILTLDTELKQLAKTYSEIYIEDSTNTRVFQWNNVASNVSNDGLITLDLPLSEEPNFGIWKIIVNEPQSKTPLAITKFEVKKYVLPKFELILSAPKVVLVEKNSINIKACAKYSYGKDVKGSLNLILYSQGYYFPKLKRIGDMTNIKVKGCQIINFPIKNLELLSKEGSYGFAINGSFTEEDTNIQAEAQTSSEIQDFKYKIDILEPTSYKPGLPTTIKIQVKTHDEVPANNKEVNVTISRGGKNVYGGIYKTNENGIISIDLEDTRLLCKGDSCKSIGYKDNFHVMAVVEELLEPSMRLSQRSFTINAWNSKQNSFLQIYAPKNIDYNNCAQNIKLNILTKINPNITLNDIDKLLHFQIQARSRVYFAGYYNTEDGELKQSINSKEAEKITFEKSSFPDETQNINSYDLTLPITENLSPEIKVLVFGIINGEVIPDNIIIKIPKCLKNKVDLKLSQPSVKTGEKIEISLKASPNSLCTLSAIDKSLTFLGKKNNIDIEKVFSALSAFNLDEDNFNTYKYTFQHCDPPPYIRPIEIGKRSLIIGHPMFYPHSHSSTEAFQKSGLVHITDLDVFKDRMCFMPRPVFVQSRVGSPRNSVSFDSVPNEPLQISEYMGPVVKEKTIVETVREFFPETWLWQIQKLNETGYANIDNKAPDSITDWIFDSYCLSHEDGLGVSKPVTLNVFQPFFVSMNLPYSVVKGEILPVQASVFNYMDKCMPITITLMPERQIQLVNGSSSTFQTCVCPDDKISRTFNVRALDFDIVNGLKVTVKVASSSNTDLCSGNEVSDINYSDTETRKIIVEPEGISKEITSSNFVVLNSENPHSDTKFTFILPPNYVPKSARAEFSIIGDAIGSALSNLNHLVQMPTGCGEQNMVKFAPLVSIVKYLKDTSQLNSKLSQTAEEYMKIGYQRQLTYRHPDGAYSAFGKSDTAGGGTWLTAFVLRCFAQSFQLKQIQIDQQDVIKSFDWLLGIQTNDGSFPQVGTQLLSKALAGGLDSSKSAGLSAYVMVSLLTTLDALKLTNYPKVKITKGLNYLKKALDDLESIDTHTLALSLYAFKLAHEDKSIISEIESELDKRAINKDGLTYWDVTKEDNKQEENSYYKLEPANIETTSYILLARLNKHQRRSTSSLPSIAKWINSQRNSLGGFYSTQDTVVALDALSKFASEFYSKRIYLHTVFSLNQKKEKPYTVSHNNRLLLKKFKLDSIIEKGENVFSLLINGSGSGLAQLNVKYNVKQSSNPTGKDFDLNVKLDKSNLGHECEYSRVNIKASYNGDEDTSSMAIVSLRLPSGWIPHEESILGLNNNLNVRLKRHEIEGNRVAFYFDEISKKDGKEFSFDIVKQFEIKNRKPGVISVYDYYDSQDNAVSREFSITTNCKS